VTPELILENAEEVRALMKAGRLQLLDANLRRIPPPPLTEVEPDPGETDEEREAREAAELEASEKEAAEVAAQKAEEEEAARVAAEEEEAAGDSDDDAGDDEEEAEAEESEEMDDEDDSDSEPTDYSDKELWPYDKLKHEAFVVRNIDPSSQKRVDIIKALVADDLAKAQS